MNKLELIRNLIWKNDCRIKWYYYSIFVYRGKVIYL